MNFVILLVYISLLAFFSSCSNDTKVIKDKIDTNVVISDEKPQKIEIDQSTEHSLSTQKVYELKEDGLYVYSDANSIIEVDELGNKKIIQKNFKYVNVPSNSSKIITETGNKTFGVCEKIVEGTKPSLKELGYERHKEREIKPEDSRFGVKNSEKNVEKKIFSEEEYLTIPKSFFTELSIQEFIENGIVIIGKHISRVEIKSLDKLPKWNDRVCIKYTKKFYDCSGKETSSQVIVPNVIADFKKNHFKENIFEFIVEEPLASNSAYLSDEEYMKLTNDIHQLIPRIYDRTIHNVANYKPDYYIVEYYNGDVLYDYHCIKLTNMACEPKLWHKLKVEPPTTSANINTSNDKCYLIISEFNSTNEARQFIKKRPVGDALIYHLQNGKSVLAIECESTRYAENEMKRYINMGFAKESLRIEKF